MGEPTWDRNKTRSNVALWLIALVFFVAVAVDYITKRADCDARHGIVVRTAFGFACVEPPASTGKEQP